MRPHRRQPTRFPRPWDSPGKNTGVGCHFLLQCMQVKSESAVAQSSPTLRNPMDCSLPGSSIHGIFQASVLEWVAIAFSSDSFYLALNNAGLFIPLFERLLFNRKTSLDTKPWRREPLEATTPVPLPGEFHGQKCLVGYIPWSHKESDRTEWLTLTHRH